MIRQHQEYDDYDVSDTSPQNLAMQLEKVFQAQEDSDTKMAAKSPLPPSPTQPSITTGPIEYLSHDDLLPQASNNSTFSTSVQSKTPDVKTLITTPSNLTQFS